MGIRVGEKIIISKDTWDAYPEGIIYGDDVWFLVATKDSIGVITSFEEYRAFILQMNQSIPPNLEEYFESYLLGCKKEIEKEEKYPIKFEKVAPIAMNTFYFNSTELRLGVGRIQLLSPDSLLVISEVEFLSFIEQS